MKNLLLVSGVGLILLGAGCSGGADDVIPVYEGDDDSFVTIYQVCEDPDSGKRIYMTSFSGDDSWWASFYDADGELIEATPEMGPGAMNNLKPNTKVENCIRTTEEYFKTKIK